MARLWLRVMLIAVIGVCAVFEKPSSMSKYVKKRETEERYCGSKLADKLREVCNSKYEGLDDIYEGVDNTDGVNNTYDGVNNTYEGVNNTYEGVNNTYEGVNNTYEGVNNTYEGVNNTYDGVNNTYEGVNNTYEGVNNTYDGVNNTYEGVNNTYDGVNNTYDGVNNTRKRDLDTVLWFQSQAEKVVSNTKFPFQPRSVVNKFKKRSLRRQKRDESGVAYECCINKGCTIGELRDYCAER